MADLNVVYGSIDGSTPTFVAASSTGDTFINNGKTYLHVKNGDTTAKTVTIKSQEKCNHGFFHDISISVPAGSEKIIGMFNKDRFNNELNKVEVTYSAITSVTVATVSI